MRWRWRLALLVCRLFAFEPARGLRTFSASNNRKNAAVLHPPLVNNRSRLPMFFANLWTHALPLLSLKKRIRPDLAAQFLRGLSFFAMTLRPGIGSDVLVAGIILLAFVFGLLLTIYGGLPK
jgi:hypothetical protein